MSLSYSCYFTSPPYSNLRGVKCLTHIGTEGVKEINPSYALKYNKFYIGLAIDSVANNFALFKPQKGYLRLHVKLNPSPELQQALEESGIVVLGYNKKGNWYKVRVEKSDLEPHKELLSELLKETYESKK
jgi:hypothetical protein